jgi:class 3 adenylate cyclase
MCGQPLSEPSPDQPGRSPASYTPRHLTEKILTSRAALEGERKQVTVLFADVKGSQEIAQRVGPEAWHEVLDRFFEILSTGVHRFEGAINQYTGDGIMALFGAPIAHEDHAQRACFAALHLKEELASFCADLRRTRSLDFLVRMGLNSGEVVVGRIGDDLRMDYTAQGHTVGLASRMESLAEPGTIYLTRSTAALVSGFFRLKDLGKFSVKGERHNLRVYELEGIGAARTRFDQSASRGLSPFVGREAEMARLEESLEAAVSGNGHAVGVVSEAGFGKNRLFWENPRLSGSRSTSRAGDSALASRRTATRVLRRWRKRRGRVGAREGRRPACPPRGAGPQSAAVRLRSPTGARDRPSRAADRSGG